jgi:hypothetical protein
LDADRIIIIGETDKQEIEVVIVHVKTSQDDLGNFEELVSHAEEPLLKLKLDISTEAMNSNNHSMDITNLEINGSEVYFGC